MALSILRAAQSALHEVKRRIDLLPLINPPSSSRLAGSPVARATWGDVLLAHAPDLLFSMKAGACMKPDLGSEVLAPLFMSRLHRVDRDAMGIHGNQQEFVDKVAPRAPQAHETSRF